MQPEMIVAICSAVFALASVVVAVLIYRLSHRNAIRPVLVFYSRARDVRPFWIVNVGSGPATNVVILSGTLDWQWDMKNVMGIQAIPCGWEHRLDWVGPAYQGAVLASYSDTAGRKYMTLGRENQNSVRQKGSLLNWLRQRNFWKGAKIPKSLKPNKHPWNMESFTMGPR